MSRLSAFERSLLERMLRRGGLPPIDIEMWNGETIAAADGPSVARLVIRKRRTLLKLLADPHLQFGDCYARGELDIRGDLVALLSRAYAHQGPLSSLAVSIRNLLSGGRRPITRSAARRNARHHYDFGNAFFRLWLDPTMTYTCAYFADDRVSLEAAQRAKMDMICRKLDLRPQQRVVDVGCGWGSLAIHMARVYGARVDAYNVSHEQVLYARSWADREGLGDRVRVYEDDYRSISGTFDAFVSVGMLEHVGRDNYRALGRVIRRALAPGGRGLIQSIGRNRPMPTHPWISKRIFPGGYTPSLGEMTAIFEPNELSVLDAENLRPHYAQTLDHWLAGFERNEEEIVRLIGDRAARTWRLYLAAANAGFRTGWLQLFQVVFAHGSGFSNGPLQAALECRCDASAGPLGANRRE